MMKNLFTYFLKQLTLSEPAIYNMMLGFIIGFIISRIYKVNIALNVSETLILSILSVGISFILLYNLSSLPFLIRFGRLTIKTYLILLYISGEIAILFYTILLIILYCFFFNNFVIISKIQYFLIIALLVLPFLSSISIFLSLLLTNGRLDCYTITIIYPIVVIPAFILSFFKSTLNPLWTFGIIIEDGFLPPSIIIILLMIIFVSIYLNVRITNYVRRKFLLK